MTPATPYLSGSPPERPCMGEWGVFLCLMAIRWHPFTTTVPKYQQLSPAPLGDLPARVREGCDACQIQPGTLQHPKPLCV